jgi:hypothetical protein
MKPYDREQKFVSQKVRRDEYYEPTIAVRKALRAKYRPGKCSSLGSSAPAAFCDLCQGFAKANLDNINFPGMKAGRAAGRIAQVGLVSLQRSQPDSRLPVCFERQGPKYPLVILTFACPAASRTSAKVRPPAKAWLMKV